MSDVYCFPARVQTEEHVIQHVKPSYDNISETTRGELTSVLLGFPTLDLFQMRGSVKPCEPVRKTLGGKEALRLQERDKYN